MSVNITARYKTVARFEAMTMAALPTGATVKSVQDRRGRLVLQCEWPRSELRTADRGATRIVVSGETLSIYWTATAAQRLEAQTRFGRWVEARLQEPVVGDWVIKPEQLFPG